MIKRILPTVGCLLLLATALPAAGITGKWTGTATRTRPDGETRESTVYINLKESGAEITGTAGENESEQWPIRKGKIDGDKITFEVETNETVYKLELMLMGDHLKGEATAEQEGRTVKAKLDLKRKTD
jgi:hypothetical protein